MNYPILCSLILLHPPFFFRFEEIAALDGKIGTQEIDSRCGN